MARAGEISRTRMAPVEIAGSGGQTVDFLIFDDSDTTGNPVSPDIIIEIEPDSAETPPFDVDDTIGRAPYTDTVHEAALTINEALRNISHARGAEIELLCGRKTRPKRAAPTAEQLAEQARVKKLLPMISPLNRRDWVWHPSAIDMEEDLPVSPDEDHDMLNRHFLDALRGLRQICIDEQGRITAAESMIDLEITAHGQAADSGRPVNQPNAWHDLSARLVRGSIGAWQTFIAGYPSATSAEQQVANGPFLPN